MATRTPTMQKIWSFRQAVPSPFIEQLSMRKNLIKTGIRASKIRLYSSSSNGEQFMFEPVAAKPMVSPMRRPIPWITALREKETHRRQWLKEHPGSSEAPPFIAVPFHDVKTKNQSSRSRQDSYTCVVLPFKQDEWFLDAYINSSGRLRIGQIFQDLDALAGVIAFKHCSPASPMIVTAAVDRIFMLKRLDDLSANNVSLSGCVTWTGKSSMEVTIKAATHSENLNANSQLSEDEIRDEDVFLTANFTMVARDPETRKAFPINQLVPKTEREKTDFVRAEKYNADKKLAASQTGLELRAPSDEESKIIHSMWLKQREYEQNPGAKSMRVVTMADSKITSTGVMQPQYRNSYSYIIFGGYLLRQTFELAYTCAAAFAHRAPRFVSLDSTTFRNPVPVGCVLYMNAVVAHTQDTTREIMIDGEMTSCPGVLVQVRVDTTVRNLSHGNTIPTGQFTYSYFTSLHNETQKPELLPQSYTDMMEYLEGRRKAQATAEFYKLRYPEKSRNSVISE